MKKLKGLYTALVTPFTNKGNVDYRAMEKLLIMQMNAKVSGIVILGTTGENATLDQYEKHKIIEFVKNKLNKNTSLIVGAGSNDTEKTINEIKGLSCYKADAILLASPCYTKPTAAGLYAHFKKIADESYAPIILYNIPSRTGISIPIEVVEKLRDHANIVGIKNSSSDPEYSLNLSKLDCENFSVLSGNDNLTLPLMSIGYSGVISVISNLLPNEMQFMIEKILKNDFRIAKILHNYLLDIINNTMIETNPIPIKFMLYKYGLISNNLRLPLTKLSKKHRINITNTMKTMQLLE